MRRIVLGVALLIACVERPPPGDATSEGEATAAATGEADATAAEPTTRTATSGPYIPEGLFMCLETELCPRWDCTGGCEGPGPEAMCAWSALYDRTSGVIEVTHCDGDCELHRLIARGEGTDAVRWQWRTQTKPPGYAEIVDCVLQPPEFFEACLVGFTPECGDPAAWVKNCQPTGEVCFD